MQDPAVGRLINEGLTTLSQILRRGQHTLGQLWTSQLSPQATEDLKAANTVLPGLRAQFLKPLVQRQPSTFVDAELVAGTTVNFPRSLVRLAWILQHAATLLPMAGDIQAVLSSQTAGVSDIHAWGLMLPSSSRVSPVTYHAVVAVRCPDLCRHINDMWELGSFASGGLPDRHQGSNSCFGTLMLELTIANSAGGTSQVAIVAQPSITVGLTRSKPLTLLVSPLDMIGLMGMAQVVATIWYLGPSKRRDNMELARIR